MRETLIPVNDGECVVAKGVSFLHDPTSSRCPQGVSHGQSLYLVGNLAAHCTANQVLTDVEIAAIVTFRAAFEGSIDEARQALAECALHKVSVVSPELIIHSTIQIFSSQISSLLFSNFFPIIQELLYSANSANVKKSVKIKNVTQDCQCWFIVHNK